MHDTTGWMATFRKREEINGGKVGYFADRVFHLKNLRENIVKETPERGKILEIGSGTGFCSIYLSLHDKKSRVYAIDIDEQVLKYCRENIDFFGVNVIIQQGDMVNLNFSDDYFDMTLSEGVLEHYSNSQIIQALNEQYRISSKAIFSVPGKKAKGIDCYSDERLLTLKQWVEIVNCAKWSWKKSFGVSWKTKDRVLFKLLYSKLPLLPKEKINEIALSYGFVLTKDRI